MSETYHVFYRTMGMSSRNEKGWHRGDFLAESAEDALRQLMRQKFNVLHARVYPGSSAYVVHVDWQPVEFQVKHEPHEVDS